MKRMNTPTLLLAAWAMGLLAVSTLADGATLTTSVPDGTCPIMSGMTVTCTPTGSTPPPIDPPPVQPPPVGGGLADCVSAGYTVQAIDIAYPVVGNTEGPITGTFGNSNAIVISFTTPAAGVNDAAVFQPTGFPPAQQIARYYTVSTSPCVFTTNNAPTGPGGTGGAVVGSAPAFNFKIGTCPSANVAVCPVYGTFLLPRTTYYITMVNRTNFPPKGIGSCQPGASCPMRIEFNK